MRGVTPVVLVHRAGGDASEWSEVLDLADTSRRTWLAVDLPGREDRAEHPGSIEAMAEFVVDRIVELGQGPAVIAGHSMGGAVSLQAALDFPAWVKGIVVIGSGAEMTVARAMVEALGSGLTLEDRAFAAQSLSPSLDPHRRDELLGRMGKVPFSVLRADLEASSNIDLRPRLGELTIPVRIVMGKDDRLVPPLKGMKLKESIEGARLVIVKGAGHMLQWEASQPLAGQIEALASEMDGQ